MSENKSFVMSLRLDEDLLRELDERAKKASMSRSKYIRHLLLEQFNLTSFFREFDAILVPRGLFASILGKLDPDSVRRVAIDACRLELDIFKEGLNESGFARELGAISSIAPVKNVVPLFLRFAIKRVLSKKGRKWLKKVSLDKQMNPRITVAASHDMGINFSIFMREYLSLFLEPIKCQEIEELGKIKENHFTFTYGFPRDELGNELFNLSDYIASFEKNLENKGKTVGD